MNENLPDTLTGSQLSSVSDSLQAALRFARVVRFRVHIVVVAVVVCCLLAGLYYATTTPVYESRASLLVLQTGTDRWTTAMSGEPATKDLMSTYRKILGSEVVLEKAVSLLPPGVRSDFGDAASSQWIAIMKENLSVTNVQETNVLEVTYQSENPSTAAEVVNCVLSAYLEFMDSLHKSTAQELLHILTKEKAALEKQLQAKESELLAARLRAGNLVVRDKDKGLNVVVERVVCLNESLIAAHAKRLEMQSRAAAVEAAIHSSENLRSYALAMTDSVGREVLLQQLGMSTGDAYTISRTNQQLLENRAKLQSELQRYGPAHRRVRTLQEQIRVAEQYLQSRGPAGDARTSAIDNQRLKPLLAEMTRRQLQQAIDHENRIRASYEQEKQRAIALDRSTAQLEMLQLDVHRLRGFYDVVLERIKDIDLGSENGMLRTSVLSRPEVPSRPVWPRLSVVALLAMVCGLSGGLGLIYVQDLLDDRFRSPEELRTQLGVPVLATVGRLEISAEVGIDAVHVHAQPTSVKSESFRTLRTAVTFCNEGVRRLVISSSEPGDGKTTVAANLAVVYAQSGKRTLLIDADMRRPGLTSLLGLRGEQGLSTCLTADGPIAEAALANLQRSVADSLDVLPAGPRPVNATGLLSSDRFAELLSWAELNYDQIVIDSSPALVSDTAIIGQVVDGAVLVVHPAKNHRRAVTRSADNLSLLGVKLLGIVTNHVGTDDAEGYYGYEYKYGYKYGYEYGYGGGDEEKPSEKMNDSRDLVHPIRKTPRSAA